MRLTSRRWVTLSIAFGTSVQILIVGTLAHADGDETDRQIAQSLFDEGRALLEVGRSAEACPKFAESQRLDPGGGTLLNLALCHELEGRTASAWAEFRDALSLAMRDARSDRQELANAHIEALRPRLTRLVVAVPGRVDDPTLHITLNRTRLSQAAWNSPITVDPGRHHIAILGTNGSARWDVSVDAREEGRTYRVDLSQNHLAPSHTSVIEPSTHRTTAFWLVLAGSGVALAASAITGIMALDAHAYVQKNCSVERAFCRVPDGADAASDARTLAWASTAALAVGVGAAVTALLLPKQRSTGRVSARPNGFFDNLAAAYTF